MKRLLDRDFAYVPSSRQTVEHLRAVFAKERKRLDAERAQQAEKVRPIKKAAAK